MYFGSFKKEKKNDVCPTLVGIKKNVAIKTSVKLFSIRTNNIHFPEFEFYNSAKVDIFQEC